MARKEKSEKETWDPKDPSKRLSEAFSEAYFPTIGGSGMKSSSRVKADGNCKMT
jgi:hypothetical protein